MAHLPNQSLYLPPQRTGASLGGGYKRLVRLRLRAKNKRFVHRRMKNMSFLNRIVHSSGGGHRGRRGRLNKQSRDVCCVAWTPVLVARVHAHRALATATKPYAARVPPVRRNSFNRFACMRRAPGSPEDLLAQHKPKQLQNTCAMLEPDGAVGNEQAQQQVQKSVARYLLGYAEVLRSCHIPQLYL